MKILIFSTAYLPLTGGAEISVKELTDRLGEEIEFDLITARMRSHLPQVERVGKVTVYRIGVGIELLDKLLVPFLGAVKALQLNRQKKYSYFWCIMASFASGAAFIANWFQKKVPIVLTLQEGDSEEWLTHRWFGLLDLSWRLALKRTDRLTVLSTYLLDRALRLGYIGPSYVIPNGVDTNRFKIQDVGLKNKDHITLITTSRLVEKNGVGNIIEAMKLLPENVSLTIIGSGRLESELKHHSQILNLKSRINFLGEVPNSEIPRHLSEADIFVRPSLSEGQGISFIEAMAAGLPVIATPVGGIPDFLIDGETGVFCQPRDPQSIAQAVMRLVSNPELARRITENSSRLVREKYDWDLIAREMKSRVFEIK